MQKKKIISSKIIVLHLTIYRTLISKISFREYIELVPTLNNLIIIYFCHKYINVVNNT